MKYVAAIVLLLFIGVALAQGNESENETGTCSGTLSLRFSPDTVRTAKDVNAYAEGLNEWCKGRTAWIAAGSCTGTKACECDIETDGECSCSFKAPTSTGAKTYALCFDFSGDGDASDAGEKATAKLTVRTATCSELVGEAQTADMVGNTPQAITSYEAAGECYSKNASTIAQCHYYYKIAADKALNVSSFGRAALDYREAGDCAKKYLPEQASDLYYSCAGAYLSEAVEREMPDSLSYYLAASDCYRQIASEAGSGSHVELIKDYVAKLQSGQKVSYNLTKLAKNPKLPVTSITGNKTTDGEEPQGDGSGNAMLYIIIVGVAMLVVVLVMLFSGKFFKREEPPEEAMPSEGWSEEGGVPPEALEGPKE